METEENNCKNFNEFNYLEDILRLSYQRCASIDSIRWINLLFLLNPHIKEGYGRNMRLKFPAVMLNGEILPSHFVITTAKYENIE